jgi:hypothetical protein
MPTAAPPPSWRTLPAQEGGGPDRRGQPIQWGARQPGDNPHQQTGKGRHFHEAHASWSIWQMYTSLFALWETEQIVTFARTILVSTCTHEGTDMHLRALILIICLACAPLAQAAPADPALARQVNAFVDSWHDDAAHARMAYFDKMAADGVYIGTDRNELWQRDAFRAWGRKYFEGKPAAWVFHATRRNVYASGDGALVWFDELLDTENMGHCMASGVLRRTAGGFEIVHYQLSLAVPNEAAKDVIGVVKRAEAASK